MSVLQAESAQTRVAGETIESAARAIEDAIVSVTGKHPAVDRWRLAGGLLTARNALVHHASACGSEFGPLQHLAAARPRLRPAVDRALQDHVNLRTDIDRLIAAVNKSSGNGAIPADYGGSARALATAIRAHQRRVTAIAYEWANRDIGGEG